MCSSPDTDSLPQDRVVHIYLPLSHTQLLMKSAYVIAFIHNFDNIHNCFIAQNSPVLHLFMLLLLSSLWQSMILLWSPLLCLSLWQKQKSYGWSDAACGSLGCFLYSVVCTSVSTTSFSRLTVPVVGHGMVANCIEPCFSYIYRKSFGSPHFLSPSFVSHALFLITSPSLCLWSEE